MENDRFTSLSPAAGSTLLTGDFPLADETQLIVTLTRAGATTALTLDDDYSVAGLSPLVAPGSGFTVTLVAASLAGDRYELTGRTGIERISDYNPSDTPSGDQIDADLTHHVQIMQELERDAADLGGRAVQVASEDFAEIGTQFLPSPQSGAVIGWDVTARRLENKVLVPSTEVLPVDFSYFGGKNDDATYNDAAFDLLYEYLQDQIGGGRSPFVQFDPRGAYRFERPGNLTNLRYPDGGRTYLWGRGATIKCYAGNEHIFDGLNSNYLTFDNFNLIGNALDPQKTGIAIGRGQATDALNTKTASHNEVKNCNTSGKFTWAGFYNNASELCLVENCDFKNDMTTGIPDEATIAAGSQAVGVPYAAILDSGNNWGVTSQYFTVTQPVGGTDSFNNQMWNNVSLRRLFGGSGLFLPTKVARLRMEGCYSAIKDGDAIVVAVVRNHVNKVAPKLITKVIEWDIDMHMEGDIPDTPDTDFDHAFRFVPMDDNGGAGIAVTARRFNYHDKNNMADKAIFRKSVIFPAGSSISLQQRSAIDIQSFHGSADDPDESLGPPSLGVFYPAADFNNGATLALPPMGGLASTVRDFTQMGDMFPLSLSNADTQYPKGSYGIIVSQGTSRNWKGAHDFGGDKDQSYTGASVPFSHFVRLHKGQIGLSGGPIIEHGTGSPEGVVTAPVNSIYIQTDAASASTQWVKSSGAGNTGWTRNIIIGDAAATGTQQINLKAAAGNSRRVVYSTGNLSRWHASADPTVESGFNKGSAYKIVPYDDAGNALSDMLVAQRASGPTGAGAAYLSKMPPYDMTVNRAGLPGAISGTSIDITDGQPSYTLGSNPLATTNGSPNVVVTWPGHGLGTNHDVSFSGATAVAGLTIAGNYRVIATTLNTFTINAGSNASSPTTGGGAAVVVLPTWCATAIKNTYGPTTSADGFSIGQATYLFANPTYYHTTASGEGGPTYETQFTVGASPSDNSGLNQWSVLTHEYNTVNRGNDEGYQPDPRQANRQTVGVSSHGENNLFGMGGNEGKNITASFRVSYTKNPNSTGYFIKTYQGFHVAPNALVSNAAGIGGRGGTGVDLFGAYHSLPTNPFTTVNGSADITVTLPAGALLLTGHNSPATCVFPVSFTVNGVAFTAGTLYALSSKTETSFKITGTGLASSGASAGGAGRWLAFTNDTPYAPLEIQGEWAHGIRMTGALIDDGQSFTLRNNSWLAWRNAADAADVQAIRLNASDLIELGKALTFTNAGDKTTSRTNLGLGTAAILDSDTDGTLAANSDTRVATQKATKTYVDGIIAANDAMVFKGVTDCSANPNYPAGSRGDTYRVSVAGKIGGASGVNVEAGDIFICLDDGTASGTQAAQGAHWSIIQTNIDGAVVGPASATDATPAVFDGATGKLIKNVTFASFKSSLAVVSTDLSDFTEAVQDVMGGLLITGGDLTWTYNDGANTLSAAITNDAVSNAKLANMAANTIKVNNTGGSADPVDATILQFAQMTGVVRCIAASGVAVAAPADTTEDTLATITLPANAMGPNGFVEVVTSWSFTGSTNNKTMKVKFGGTVFLGRVQATAANLEEQMITIIRNRNATNSQYGMPSNFVADGFGASTAVSNVTAAVDTTANVTILITGQKASSGETLQLEGYHVKVCYMP